MTLGEAILRFGYEIDKSSVSKVESSIKSIKNLATNLIGTIGIVFSVAGLSDLAQASADAKALTSQFEQVFGDMEDTASESLDTIADDAGALVTRMKGSFTQLAAFTKTTGANEARRE